MRTRTYVSAVAVTVVTAMATAACGGGGTGSAADEPTLTLYNAQHEQLLKEIVPGFTEATGIKVRTRNGDDFELANQLVQEGSASPADVFLTENSPAMTLVQSRGLFAKLDAATLAQVPPQFSPANGRWMGFAARSTVLAYNTSSVKKSELPSSILELAEPQWKGRVSFSPSGADFQAIVSAVVDLEGEAAALTWLKGLKTNGTVYQGNNIVLKSVNDGQVDVGILFHYYWYRDQVESGASSDNTALHYFGGQDPGAFVSVSGAGVLKSSDNPAAAQQFVKYVSGLEGQTTLAESYALEYPLNPDVPASPVIKPLGELEPPQVEVSGLNGPVVIELMQRAGLL